MRTWEVAEVARLQVKKSLIKYYKICNFWATQMLYTSKGSWEQSFFRIEVKHLTFLYWKMRKQNIFEICKKKCYHLKEGLKKYPDQWVDFLGLKPTSFVNINGVLLKWQFSEFDLLQPLRKWNSHHFSLLKNKLIFIVSCFSQCVNRQSKNKKLTYVQNSNFA